MKGKNALQKKRRAKDKDRERRLQPYGDLVAEHGPRKKLPPVKVKRQ